MSRDTELPEWASYTRERWDAENAALSHYSPDIDDAPTLADVAGLDDPPPPTRLDP